MRYLVINIFIVVFVSSCSLPTTKGLLEHVPKKAYITNSYFSNLDKDYVYKAKLQILKHNFGGILIIKKIGSDHHRVVFTTEFGNKLFDLEFKDNDFNVNFILDKLNKNFILKMLRHDFQTLISQNNIVVHQFSSEVEDLYQSDKGKFQNFYVFSKQTNELTKIISTSKNKERLIISFLVTENGISTSINLSHRKFKANMDLNYIGKID